MTEITNEEEKELQDETESQEDETDYKLLYEKEAEKAGKYENRFKKTAKELNDLKAKQSTWEVDVDVSKVVDQRINEELFFLNNPVAKEFKQDIQKLQKDKNLTTDEAFTLYLAQNKPELLTKKSDVWVDWVAKTVEAQKAYKDMTYEEINALRPVRRF